MNGSWIVVEAALRALRASLPPALLQTIGWAVGLAVVTAVLHLRGITGGSDLPGADCAPEAALLSADTRDGWRDTFRMREVDLLAAEARELTLHPLAGTIATVQLGQSKTEQRIMLAGRGLFAALCVRADQGILWDASARSSSDAVVHRSLRDDLSGLSPGSRLQVGALSVRVTGVLDRFAGMRAGLEPDRVWIPIEHAAAVGFDLRAADQPLVRVVARPNPGASTAEVEEELKQLAQRLRTLAPDVRALQLSRNLTMSGSAYAKTRTYLQVLMALAVVLGGLVLTNAAIYYRGRAAQAEGLASILAAVGAPRRALLLLVAIEPALLLAIAWLLGGWAAGLVTDGVAQSIPDPARGLGNVQYGRPSPWPGGAIAALLATIVIAIRFVAVSKASRPNRLEAQRRAASRLPYLLALEVLFAVIVLSLAAQASWGYLRTLPPAPAYEPEGLWSFLIVGPYERKRPNLATAWRAAVAGFPAGSQIALSENLLPIPGQGFQFGQLRLGARRVPIRMNRVSPEFFATLQLPITGAGFSFSDPIDAASGEPQTIVLNRLAVDALWPNGLPANAVVDYQSPRLAARDDWLTARVVGIVDERSSGFGGPTSDRSLGPLAYTPSRDAFEALLLVRPAAGMDIERLMPALTGIVEKISPGATIIRRDHVADLYDQVIARERATALLLVTLALGALSVAAMGALAVMFAMLAAMRTEFAVRFATGSTVAAARRRLVAVLVPPVVLGLVFGALPAAWIGEVFVAAIPTAGSPLPAILAALTLIATPAAAFVAAYCLRMAPAAYLPWLRRE